MQVVLDNNVIIDALEPRSPFDVAATKLLRCVLNEEITGLVTASSLTDIFYVLSRKAGEEQAKRAIQNIAELLEVISVTGDDCAAALALPMKDFEDAVIAVCAKKAGADCVVSRDEKFIGATTTIEVIKPDQLLARLNKV